MRGSVRAGLDEFVVVEIDGDDGMSAGEMSPEDCTETDPPAADDDDGFPDAHLGIVRNHAEAGRKGIREEGTGFKIETRRDHGQPVLGNDAELLKGGDVPSVRLRPIGSQVRATAGFNPAAGTPVNDDPIAGFDMPNLRSDLTNNTTRLVAQQVREVSVGTLRPLDFADLGTANPGDSDLYEHLAKTQCRNLNLFNHERLTLFNKDSRGRFQEEEKEGPDKDR